MEYQNNPNSNINPEVKLRIVTKLNEFVKIKGSAVKASKILKGVSEATISQIKQGNWQNIDDAMWRNVASQIRFKEYEWHIAKTKNFNELVEQFSEIQNYSLSFDIVGPAGCGKSEAAEYYVAHNPNAFYICCIELWAIDDFLKATGTAIGLEFTPYKRVAAIDKIVERLRGLPTPLLIFDEAHNMNGQIRQFFKSLYNMTEDYCGIIRLGTPELKEQIKNDIAKSKYAGGEVNSRMGAKPYEIERPDPEDMKLVCKTNGIVGAAATEIVKDSSGDLRRVKRLVLADKRTRDKQEA